MGYQRLFLGRLSVCDGSTFWKVRFLKAKQNARRKECNIWMQPKLSPEEWLPMGVACRTMSHWADSESGRHRQHDCRTAAAPRSSCASFSAGAQRCYTGLKYVPWNAGRRKSLRVLAASYFSVFAHICSKLSIIPGSPYPRMSGEAKGLLKLTPLKNFQHYLYIFIWYAILQY